MTHFSFRSIVPALIILGLSPLAAQDNGRPRTFAISARGCAFSPASIDVEQNDLVRITLTAEDAPHSFTIDKYRIAKRAEPGKPAMFEFRADQPGRFPFYSTLLSEGCRDMRGVLTVTGPK